MERRGESCNKRHALSYFYFTGFPYTGKKSYNIKFWSRNQRIDWLCSRSISFVSCIHVHNQEKTLWEVWKNLRAVFEGATLTGFTMYPVKERTLVSLYDPEVGQWLMIIRIMVCQRNLSMDSKRFLWCSMIRVIWHHWKGADQLNQVHKIRFWYIGFFQMLQRCFKALLWKHFPPVPG